MSAGEHYDVVIVGAGPVGLVLSALLANEGLEVLTLEREADPGYRPRARHLDGEAMRVLQTIGVAEASEKVMRSLGGFKLADAQGRTLLEQPVDPTCPGSQGWIDDFQMFQPLIVEILFEYLRQRANASLRTRSEVTSLDQRDDHVFVGITDTLDGTLTSVSAKYAVGCDGADSRVRQLIGARYQSLGPEHPFLVIDATPLRDDFRLPDAPNSVIVCDPRRPHYVSPGSDTVPMRFEFMVMPGDDAETLSSPASVAELTKPYLRDGDARIDRASVYRFHSLLVDNWRVGRVLLAGDAAHVQPPFMGQGLCSGIRDASNLAWKLAMVCHGQVGDELLDTYHSERARHAEDWINEANRIGAIVMTSDPEEAAARDERLLGGEYKELRPVTPILGPGLHGTDEPPAGTLAPQPFLPDGRRLDDAVGSRFLVAAENSLWLELPEGVRRELEETPIMTVLTEGDGTASLLAAYQCRAVVLRPDRYVLGLAEDAQGLARVLARIPSLGRSARVPDVAA